MPGTPTIYDISPEISERTAVFPGDVPFRRKVGMAFARGDHLALSSFETTPHIGAHADAPSHYHADGHGIGARALHYYLGPCQVVTVAVPRGERVQAADVAGVRIQAERVLFRTRSYPDPRHWNGDFNSLSPGLVDALARQGVVLVGIDTPSVDPSAAKVLEAHQAIYRNDMAVLEGLVLDAVPDGAYMLAALPLKLKDADGSPVRAVLWKS